MVLRGFVACHTLADVTPILGNFGTALQAEDPVQNEHWFVRKLGHPLLVEGFATRKVIASGQHLSESTRGSATCGAVCERAREVMSFLEQVESLCVLVLDGVLAADGH